MVDLEKYHQIKARTPLLKPKAGLPYPACRLLQCCESPAEERSAEIRTLLLWEPERATASVTRWAPSNERSLPRFVAFDLVAVFAQLGTATVKRSVLADPASAQHE